MLTVHHLNNSRSQRVLWLLEELQLDYTVVRYQRDSATMLAPAALKKIHPLGKSPVVVDEDQVLAESGAIIETLVERYDSARRLASSPGTPERLRYRYWLHYAEGSAMPPMLLSLVLARIAKAPMPFFAKPIARGIVGKAMKGFVSPQVRLHLDYMEGELGKRRWFAGDDFSAADIQMSFPLEAAQARAGLQDYPRLADFLQRIHARPAYQRALAQGGPYDLLT
ncbi:glutathione S-transferase [Pseudoxanthomonas dokdonensis]|uniref:glutathione transferase n=1 Tax=Pseudoxanthomonas dokdonensis TaxID=344882 RepID=A0A0R0CHZ3_9GAMM|nr:glutathione S-transferase [Pseudoxanthomonas dokdonensis]KRG68790.1 glutathione S-transferase [Pseudoxanthomonas dokdonensis]